MNHKTKSSIYWAFIFPALLFSFSSLAQDGENLVKNGSFEKAQNKKIRKVGDIELAENWFSPTGSKADIFAAEAKTPEVQTPSNIYGTEEPKDGYNYAGIIAYSYREKENRSYLTTELSTPLKKGMRYQVQFYASLAELSKYSSNRIGAHFSKKAPGSSQKVPAMILDTDVEHPKQEAFDGLFGWDLVCGEFTAKGGEKFMTIGNFTNDGESINDRVRKPRDVKGTQIIAAYYYIDDVSVRLLGPDEQCNCNYPDEADVKTMTLYQRSPEIAKDMTPAQKLTEYNVYYAAGRYDVKRDGQQTIDRILELLKANPDLNIQIIGHADSQETANGATQDISSKRANYIMDILMEEGIAKNRIDVKDDSDRTPSQYIKDGDEDNLKSAKNRRVSFKAF